MAHGGEELALGGAGSHRRLAGFAQFRFQALAVADIDPAAEQALEFAASVVEGHQPLIDLVRLAVHLDAAIEIARLAMMQQLAVFEFQGMGQAWRTDALFGRRGADQFFQRSAEELFVGAVAGAQATLQVAHVEWRGQAVEQRKLEGQLVAQLVLCEVSDAPDSSVASSIAATAG